MTNNYPEVSLTEHELHILHLHLIRYFPETQKTAKKLLARKSELIHRLLFPHFGLKQTLFGLRQKAPYQHDDLEMIKDNLHEINLELYHLKNEQECFIILYPKIAKAFDSHVGPEYSSITELENQEWKFLTQQYNDLGVKETEGELRKIVERF